MISLALQIHESSGKELFDDRVVAGLQTEGDVGQVLEFGFVSTIPSLEPSSSPTSPKRSTARNFGALLTSTADTFLE